MVLKIKTNRHSNFVVNNNKFSVPFVKPTPYVPPDNLNPPTKPKMYRTKPHIASLPINNNTHVSAGAYIYNKVKGTS